NRIPRGITFSDASRDYCSKHMAIVALRLLPHALLFCNRTSRGITFSDASRDYCSKHMAIVALQLFMVIG
ncbi:MAG: hypothetical protein IIV19_01140, partial [Bacteroidaceae bacterium]|nr:hypothetical protein [Bacteroidaceae bacterium]